ncbi:hypothetical protein NST17_20285 [Caldifermentibacillus hisashii]|uniref:IDEAL domain-containing protein n=1 Tax=Caldifermentibacillus hisashii TaxID=996558 RepID=A0ABU9K3V0_9BACI
MILAREYIQELVDYAQQAINSLYNDDIQRSLGLLDCVEDRLTASKILLREELRERRNKLK